MVDDPIEGIRSSSGRINEAAAMAPLLTIGLAATRSRRQVIELNASPVGSTPIRRLTAASPRSSSGRP